jgi:DNA-binding MarR family transcriptional regulator
MARYNVVMSVHNNVTSEGNNPLPLKVTIGGFTMDGRTKEQVRLIGADGNEKLTGTIHQLPIAKYTRGFMTTFSDSKEYLVDNLTHFELRVLARLEKRLDYGNWAPVIADDIAQEMNSAKSNISTAIRSLMNKAVIERSPRELKIGRIWQYRLNADYGWKGTAAEWHQHQRERQKYGEVVQLFPVGSEQQKQKFGCDPVIPSRERDVEKKVRRMFRVTPRPLSVSPETPPHTSK